MEKKNITEVVIDGNIYKLGGYESPEYIQQVAAYLNSRITEMKALDGYHHLPTSQKSLMLELNVADDYFKAKKSADHLEKELADKDKELYGVKHDLVDLQVKQEEAGRTIHSLREENSDYQKRIVQLEASLRQLGNDTGVQPVETVLPEKVRTAVRTEASASAEGTAAKAPQAKTLPESPAGAEPGNGAAQKAASEKTPALQEETETETGLAEADLTGIPEKEPGAVKGAAPEAVPDPAEVFRPDSHLLDRQESGDTQQELSPEKSEKTFIPDASKREAMLRSARENFLQNGGRGKKSHRRH